MKTEWGKNLPVLVLISCGGNIKMLPIGDQDNRELWPQPLHPHRMVSGLQTFHLTYNYILY